jgi:hypothetical protein
MCSSGEHVSMTPTRQTNTECITTSHMLQCGANASGSLQPRVQNIIKILKCQYIIVIMPLTWCLPSCTHRARLSSRSSRASNLQARYNSEAEILCSERKSSMIQSVFLLSHLEVLIQITDARSPLIYILLHLSTSHECTFVHRIL